MSTYPLGSFSMTPIFSNCCSIKRGMWVVPVANCGERTPWRFLPPNALERSSTDSVGLRYTLRTIAATIWRNRMVQYVITAVMVSSRHNNRSAHIPARTNQKLALYGPSSLCTPPLQCSLHSGAKNDTSIHRYRTKRFQTRCQHDLRIIFLDFWRCSAYASMNSSAATSLRLTPCLPAIVTNAE